MFDRVRTCDNHCPFCFIYQLPKGMRRSLYLKDDDYRLSLLYGNFTTLTRFTEADLERVVTEGLGPLYVSIHATDPEVRTALLRNRRGATSLRWLGALLDAGVEVHGQIVVCPGVNDGEVLDDTLLGILDRFPRARDRGRRAARCVGLNRRARHAAAHHAPRRTRCSTRSRRGRTRYLAALGRRLVFAADEYYLMAGRPFPDADEYEGFAQHENGIGMARTFEAEVHAALAGHAGRPATGPRAGLLRVGRRRAGRGLPRAADATHAGSRCATRARRARPIVLPHRRPTAKRCSRRCCPRSPTLAGRRGPAASRWRTSSSAATSASPGR